MDPKLHAQAKAWCEEAWRGISRQPLPTRKEYEEHGSGNLEPPPPFLRPWEPGLKEGFSDQSAFVPVPPRGFIVDRTFSPEHERILDRALKALGDKAPLLFHANPEFAGFQWHGHPCKGWQGHLAEMEIHAENDIGLLRPLEGLPWDRLPSGPVRVQLVLFQDPSPRISDSYPVPLHIPMDPALAAQDPDIQAILQRKRASSMDPKSPRAICEAAWKGISKKPLPSYEEWKARPDLPKAPPCLRPWDLSDAEERYPILHDPGQNQLRFKELAHQPILVSHTLLAPEEAQAFKRAYRRGLQEKHPHIHQAYFPNPEFEGYPWYNDLFQTKSISTQVRPSKNESFESTEDIKEIPARPEAIRLHIEKESLDGDLSSLSLPADFAYGALDVDDMEESHPMVRQDSPMAAEELAGILRATYFETSDEVDTRIQEHEAEIFMDQAMLLARSILNPGPEGALETLQELASRDLAWAVPRGFELHLELRRKQA